MTVTRYHVHSGMPVPSPNGTWVLWTDIEQTRDQNAGMYQAFAGEKMAEIAKLKKRIAELELDRRS